MNEDIIVVQSAESSSKYNVEVLGFEVELQFLSATKGKLEFLVSVNGKQVGKFNLLSQHSIRRIIKPGAIPALHADAFEQSMLTVGVMLRDGNYKTEKKTEKRQEAAHIGKPSSMGLITPTTLEEFLERDDLLDAVSDILHHSRPEPFIGDEANLILTFLVILSCKTGHPLNLEMVGQSASGKTYMALTARNGFPDDMVNVLAGASREAMKYDYDETDEDGNFISHVDNRCIIILEKDESEAFMRRMKPLMSGDDDELIWKTPIRNELTGEIETKAFIIKGRPSFITLTTRNPSEAEQITRQLLMTPDSSSEKVSAVVSGSLMARARPEELDIHIDLDLCKGSMGALNKVGVRNIFAPLMVDFFPARSAQHQRDVKKVLSIVDSLATLHQRQRPTEEINGEPYILASIEDNVMALSLADSVLRASLSGVPDDTWLVFLEMVKMDEAGRAMTEETILKWLHIHAFNCSKHMLSNKYLSTLEDAGLIEVASRGGGRGGRKKSWRIVNARKSLVEAYALAPLFVKTVRSQLKSTIQEFTDVLSSAQPADSTPRLAPKQKATLLAFGVHEDWLDVAASILVPRYLTYKGRGSVVYRMLEGMKARQTMFNKMPAWFTESSAEDEKTLERHQALQETLREASVDSTADESDDYWNNLMESHMAEWDNEENHS